MNRLFHVINSLFNIPGTLFTKVLNIETTSIQGGQWSQRTYLVYLETYIYFDKKWIHWEIRETSEFKVCFRLAHVSFKINELCKLENKNILQTVLTCQYGKISLLEMSSLSSEIFFMF